MSGFQRGNEVIYISQVPGLKKPCLLIGNKYAVQKIASFDSQEYADGFTKMLDEWFGAEIEEDESEPLRHLSYPEEQLEHAIRMAESQSKDGGDGEEADADD